MMSFYFIDDDKNICNILKLIINERGLGVCCGSANNAAEALEDLPSAKPDIVIVDLLMPEMDGISFVKPVSYTHLHQQFRLVQLPQLLPAVVFL